MTADGTEALIPHTNPSSTTGYFVVDDQDQGPNTWSELDDSGWMTVGYAIPAADLIAYRHKKIYIDVGLRGESTIGGVTSRVYLRELNMHKYYGGGTTSTSSSTEPRETAINLLNTETDSSLTEVQYFINEYFVGVAQNIEPVSGNFTDYPDSQARTWEWVPPDDVFRKR